MVLCRSKIVPYYTFVNNHTHVRNQKDLFMAVMKDEKAGVTFVLDSELKCSQ